MIYTPSTRHCGFKHTNPKITLNIWYLPTDNFCLDVYDAYINLFYWCAFELICILWSKYNDMKFGGGVKVNTINIKRGWALGLGVSLN